MKYNEVKKIVDGIAESEFRHIQKFVEKDFADNDLEYKKESEMSQLLYKKLEKGMTEEQKDSLDELCSSFNNEMIELCRFYFKEGLRAGLSNLKFLSEINYIENIM